MTLGDKYEQKRTVYTRSKGANTRGHDGSFRVAAQTAEDVKELRGGGDLLPMRTQCDYCACAPSSEIARSHVKSNGSS